MDFDILSRESLWNENNKYWDISTFKEQIEKKSDKFSIKNAVGATGETFLGNLGKGELKTKEIFNNAIYHMTENFCFEWHKPNSNHLNKLISG